MKNLTFAGENVRPPPVQLDQARVEAIMDEPNPFRAEQGFKEYARQLRPLIEARKALEFLSTNRQIPN